MPRENDSAPRRANGPPRGAGLAARLAPYQERIESELEARLSAHRLPCPIDTHAPPVRPLAASQELTSVIDPIRHVIQAGGKRLRPILCLLAAEATRGDSQRALGVATGIEYLHTFTLVHDDVMDDDLMRRGHPTVHAIWGAPVAITAGDGLYALAMATLLDPENGDPAVLARIARRAAQVSFALCAGQTRDLLFENRASVDPEEYHAMINEKTAVLMGLSVEAGALAAGADERDVADLHEYGIQLGLAFQVKDDLLDLEASEQEIGKPPDSDLRAGKKTYPIVHALRSLPAKKQERLQHLLQAPEKRTTPAMVSEMRGLLDEAGSFEASAEHARRLGENAKAALRRFASHGDGEREPIRILEEIVDHVTHRTR